MIQNKKEQSRKMVGRKSRSVFIIANLIISLFAFCFIIYNIDLVKADDTPTSSDHGLHIEPTPQQYISNAPETTTTNVVQTNAPEPVAKIGEHPVDYNPPVEQPKVPATTPAPTNGPVDPKAAAVTGGGLVAGSGLTGADLDKYIAFDKANYNAALARGDTATANTLKSQITELEAEKAAAASKGAFGGATFGSALWSAAGYALVAYGAGQMIGSAAGLGKVGTNQLSEALAIGAFVGKFVYEYYAMTTWPVYGAWISFGIGALIAIAYFALTYRESVYHTVTYQCLPWQPPIGGSDCEKCNKGDLPCTEYRCKSLGQTCSLENVGTGQEKCVSKNANDIKAPVIYPNPDELTSGYKYTDVKTSPPGPGFRIVSSADAKQECIKAFTPLRFGISLDEPGRCKIDYNTTAKFDEMQFWFGGTNLVLYNHTESFSLPGPQDINTTGNPILQNGGKWTFYIRCQDANGNANAAEYAVRFCIDPSPDTTPAEIKYTSIVNQGCVPEKQDTADVSFYVNEPAECRWSFDDKSYDAMEKNMTCDTDISNMNEMQLYTCTAHLTAIKSDFTKYYIRCKDQPWLATNSGGDTNQTNTGRNTNTQSFVYEVRTSPALKLKSAGPTSTQYGSTDPAPFYLTAETTSGCSDGKSVCYYATEDVDGSYLPFFQTNDVTHKQRQDLSAATYNYYIKCIDNGGNVAKAKIRFNVEITKGAPIVLRAYEETGNLKIVTLRESECAYSLKSCDFSIKAGTEMPYANSTIHLTDWSKDKTYYIKCKDEFRPEEAACSIIVKPTDISK